MEQELIENKAREIALTLVGSDQNPEPIIEALKEMAKWQKEKIVQFCRDEQMNNFLSDNYEFVGKYRVFAYNRVISYLENYTNQNNAK